jgi:hypothetical protein
MLKAFPLNEALNIALSFTYCFNILCLNLTCAMSALRFSVCFVIDLRISSTAVQLCATILTNEAFVTFSFNKTSDWLDSLPRAERDKILNDARKQGREAKQKFKDR